MSQMLAYHGKKAQTKTTYANTFNWNFCTLQAIVDSQLQLIVQFVSLLILASESARARVCVCAFGEVAVWG